MKAADSRKSCWISVAFTSDCRALAINDQLSTRRANQRQPLKSADVSVSAR